VISSDTLSGLKVFE